VRIVDKNLSGSLRKLIKYYLIGMMRIRRISRSETFIGYSDRKVLDPREVKRFEWSEILGG
jgi:hypothetical protein